MLYSVKKIHLIGIGGIGMSGIAELLFNKNFFITGSDISDSPNVQRLKDLGIKIFIGHDKKNITNSELVIFSDAIPKNNIELKEAFNKNLLVYPRAKMISEIAKLNNSTVGIAGTHGKTTTTSMVGNILQNLNLDPTVIVGGVVKSLESNSLLGSGETFVVEADEYNKSLLHLNPTIAVINNIDFEHIECYKNLNDLKNTFIQFANSVPFYGKVCICLDYENTKSIIKKIDKPLITYGIENLDADIIADSIKQKKGKTSFNVVIDNQKFLVNLAVPGKYNVYNALAAISVCYTMGINTEKVCNALSSFSGVKRRFDIKSKKNVMIVDDYAHHPVEVSNVIQATKKNWNKKLNVIFQPHLFSRTKKFHKDFADALMKADCVMITEIFGSREKNDISISSQLIIDEMIKLKHPNVSFITFDKIVDKVKSIATNEDIFLTMGAGNIWRCSEELGKYFND